MLFVDVMVHVPSYFTPCIRSHALHPLQLNHEIEKNSDPNMIISEYEYESKFLLKHFETSFDQM